MNVVFSRQPIEFNSFVYMAYNYYSSILHTYPYKTVYFDTLIFCVYAYGFALVDPRTAVG